MLGAVIKEYLNNNGIKQTFLSEKTGIKRSRISEIFNRGRKIDAVEYYKICQALNVPLDMFVSEVEK